MGMEGPRGQIDFLQDDYCSWLILDELRMESGREGREGAVMTWDGSSLLPPPFPSLKGWEAERGWNWVETSLPPPSQDFHLALGEIPFRCVGKHLGSFPYFLSYNRSYPG
jgi:hypothetical protein